MSAVKAARPRPAGRTQATTAERAASAPIRRKSTFLLMCTGLVGVVAAMCLATMAMTHGRLTYIIDDTYIHLTMARNFVDNGTWGMVPGAFESSSSSPGWVAFLGFFVKVVPSITEWWPLIINLVCSAGILWIFAYKQDLIVIRNWSPLRVAAVLLLPSTLFLPGLVQLGMEHSLHTLLVLILLRQFERMTQASITPRRLATYGALLLATTAIRMETAFLALAMGLILIAPVAGRVRRRDWSALQSSRLAAFAVSGFIPAAVIGAIGFIDLSHGQYFMPNSIVEKTGLLNRGVAALITPNPQTIWSNFVQDPFLIGVMVFGAVAIAQRVALRPVWIAWLAATVLHGTYAQFGWYERYQAYLLITGLLLTLRSAPEMTWLQVPIRKLVFFAMTFVLLPLIYKYPAIWTAPGWATDQYVHQDQTAQFLAKYYDGQTVMLNDIGHVSYRHTGGMVDMWGLASFEVVKAQHDGYYNSSYALTLAQKHHAAIVVNASFEFDPYVPKGWVKAAQWEVNHKVDKREAYLSFWAPNQAAADTLRAQMREFMKTMLPNGDSIPSIVG